jgi:hypothetical protein
MNANPVEEKLCAGCGCLLGNQKYGKYHDFCSVPCRKVGRAFCKLCGKPLEHTSNNSKKDFCNSSCSRRYNYVPIGTRPRFYSGERNRTTCKACGEPILQPKYTIRQFCGKNCANKYRLANKGGQSLLEEWGMYGLETRKMIKEVQELMGMAAAKRLATAIDREYILRSKKAVVVPHHHNYSKKLTWEQVDEIRHLHAIGQMPKELGEKYGVSSRNIGSIVRFETWNFENDPRKQSIGRGEFVEKIASHVATNPDTSAYALSKLVGCSIETARKYKNRILEKQNN